MLLTSILCIPLLVGLTCLVARPRRVMESLNTAGFVCVLLLGSVRQLMEQTAGIIRGIP